MQEYDLRCKECNRWLRIKPKGTVVATVDCPYNKCKEPNNIKIISSDHYKDITHKFADVTKIKQV